jgi:hypothetical protein
VRASRTGALLTALATVLLSGAVDTAAAPAQAAVSSWRQGVSYEALSADELSGAGYQEAAESAS